MSKYKTQRPEDKWDNNGPQERPRGEKKRTTQRLAKPRKPAGSNPMPPTSEAYFPQSDANFPASDANFPMSEANFAMSEAPAPPQRASPQATRLECSKIPYPPSILRDSDPPVLSPGSG